MKYVVNVSGGLTSFEALRRTLERHGKSNTIAVFADTLIEDEDLYRFLDDQERYFDIQIHRVSDGRTPFQVWYDDRAITIGRVAPCSKRLKQELLDAWMDRHLSGIEHTRIFGMEWSETDRMERLQSRLAPIPVWFPLADRPYVEKCDIAAHLEQIGIKVPRLYASSSAVIVAEAEFVKAGHAHWAHLWKTLPDRYAMWEHEEEKFRAWIEKDISILKDRRGGTVKPLTLKTFRERLERGERYDGYAWGGCGCFAPEYQERMADLLSQAEVQT